MMVTTKICGKILKVRGGYDLVYNEGARETRIGPYETVSEALDDAKGKGLVFDRNAPSGEVYLRRD